MPNERKEIIQLVNEANTKGASKEKACDLLNVNLRSYQRWVKEGGLIDKRKGASKKVSNKLTEMEEKEIVDICCSNRFKDLYPAEIVAILAEEGRYIASESSYYRVLRKNGLLKHRSNTRVARKRKKIDELKATGPNQVWSWDITYLRTDIKGKYYYLYLFMDVWSRLIVGWGVFEEESGENAAFLMKAICKRRKIKDVVLHSDNGSPMKSANMLATLFFLGVIPSFSRPRTSNDNAYSESLFKTLKYTVGYPGYFIKIDDAKEWMIKFEDWYNNNHRHSRINYVTPMQRHNGFDKKILGKRKETYEKAKAKNPERWTKDFKRWNHLKVVILNSNSTKTIKNIERIAS